ncbi:hypothetical protein [Nostoc sp. LEGE 12450]|uniref:hypothetical protein n=1 Tax=Nostoc sp. LEGE 12450 TaxID=1828643 RepID=UPI00187F6291|nr:hypothetical protein [Nostoc sp. LEGE 12450]MBE8990047.1 hypothetical protein [Nostoc sp. LEGE 12450]
MTRNSLNSQLLASQLLITSLTHSLPLTENLLGDNGATRFASTGLTFTKLTSATNNLAVP